MFSRYLLPRIREALLDTPVVLLNGPRQAGKTTLVQQFVNQKRRYVTLDDAAVLFSAKQDPAGLIRSLDGAVIDEIQRAPTLLLAIKKAVDENRSPGRFLLTGSANVMMLPQVSDSLAGRLETLSLLPLAACEVNASNGSWLDAVFQKHIPHLKPGIRSRAYKDDLMQRVLCGGYPEAVSRVSPRRRSAWAKQYIHALITRDVLDVGTVEKLDYLPRLLKALAYMTGQLCNFAQLAGQVGLDNKTASKYLAVFEHMFLLRRVEPWSNNRVSRIVKSPKIHFLDSGLLGYLMGLTEQSAMRNRSDFGRALESFVYGELLKQSGWAEADYNLFIYRDKEQVEVDFVIENSQGFVVGVEVKAAASVQSADLVGLKKFAALAGSKYIAGIVLYDGSETLPLGNGLWGVPLSTLWLNWKK